MTNIVWFFLFSAFFIWLFCLFIRQNTYKNIRRIRVYKNGLRLHSTFSTDSRRGANVSSMVGAIICSAFVRCRS